MLLRKIVAGWLALLTFAAAAPPSAAQSVAEFFGGKTVSLHVAASAGASFGLYAQILAEHMPRHMPGHPAMIVTYMPGAGGARAANFIYGAAPKDGLHLGVLLQDTALSQRLRPEEVRYDVAKMNWIGRMVSMHSVLAVWHSAPARTLAEAMRTELLLGSEGKGSQSYTNPMMLNNLLGTKFKVILGYRGAADVFLAMEQGEVHGRSTDWFSWKVGKESWVAENKIVPLVQVNLVKSPDLSQVPLLLDLARNETERALFAFTSNSGAIGRTISAPPDLPRERVEALRRAFDATMRDAQFQADAKSRKILLDPASGEELADLMSRIIAAPPELVERARKAMGFE